MLCLRQVDREKSSPGSQKERARVDRERICAYLAECGIAFGEVSSRYGAEGQGPSIYLNDPEGNTVELKGPPS